MIRQKFKKSIVRLNLILSVGFGILMGIVFPLYANLFVTFKSTLLLIIFAVGCIIAGIIVGFGAFLITRLTILKVVKSVSSELREIANGEGDLSKLIQFDSDDEIGKLVYWFNLFFERLGKMVGTTKRNLLQSKGKYADLTAEMGKISLSMQNVTDCIHAIKETQLNHIGMVDKMETSLQILDDSIVIVITNVMEFFNQLDTLTNIVINQSGAVDNVIQNIAHVSREIGNAENTNTGKRGQDRVSLYATGSELIESSYKLIEKSRQNAVKIGERLKEIDDIAAHINIIAINASIEAAQAGVVGKGFHIISGEIRKFADFTNRFTKDIQNVVNEIKNDTEIAIGTIRTNQTDYNSILNGVAHTTDSLYGAAGNIKTVTEEVKFNYRIIGELLVNLKEKIESLKKNSEYCHVACNDLKEISEDVQEQINSIDLETVEINNNNLNVLRDSNDFEKGLVNVERQISQYNISEE